MGFGAVAAPVLVLAPEAAIPLAGIGIYSGAREISNGNTWTGIFDIGTSLAPFKFASVRGSVAGRGSLVGQVRGLGPAASLSERAGRFAAIEQSLPNFRPYLFGRRVGVGINPADHSGVTIEDPSGNVTLFDKFLKHSDEPGIYGEYEASWHSGPPSKGLDTLGRPWQYESLEVPRSTAEAMNTAARARQAGREPFVHYRRSCGNFTADILEAGGFRGMAPVGEGGSPQVWSNWTAFVRDFNSARASTYSAGFWSGAHLTTPNRKCVPQSTGQPAAVGR